jgi:hypothetical protein
MAAEQTLQDLINKTIAGKQAIIGLGTVLLPFSEDGLQQYVVKAKTFEPRGKILFSLSDIILLSSTSALNSGYFFGVDYLLGKGQNFGQVLAASIQERGGNKILFTIQRKVEGEDFSKIYKSFLNGNSSDQAIKSYHSYLNTLPRETWDNFAKDIVKVLKSGGFPDFEAQNFMLSDQKINLVDCFNYKLPTELFLFQNLCHKILAPVKTVQVSDFNIGVAADLVGKIYKSFKDNNIKIYDLKKPPEAWVDMFHQYLNITGLGVFNDQINKNQSIKSLNLQGEVFPESPVFNPRQTIILQNKKIAYKSPAKDLPSFLNGL